MISECYKRLQNMKTSRFIHGVTSLPGEKSRGAKSCDKMTEFDCGLQQW